MRRRNRSRRISRRRRGGRRRIRRIKLSRGGFRI